jgi:hypothetical protein
MPSATASSSIALSSAKLPVDSPGARMNVGDPTFIRTSSWSVSMFGDSYIIRVIMPLDSRKSSSVDVVAIVRCLTTVRVPSFFAPSVICCDV